jgi:hypothetical protein
MAAFETSDTHRDRRHRPLRVSTRKEHVYREAKELIEFLPGWEMVSEDVGSGRIVCKRRRGLLSGTATVVVHVDGSDEHPTTTVNVRSESSGGLFSRDRANVTEFLVKFTRRVV